MFLNIEDALSRADLSSEMYEYSNTFSHLGTNNWDRYIKGIFSTNPLVISYSTNTLFTFQSFILIQI